MDEFGNIHPTPPSMLLLVMVESPWRWLKIKLAFHGDGIKILSHA
jgi:hypothetical protein